MLTLFNNINVIYNLEEGIQTLKIPAWATKHLKLQKGKIKTTHGSSIKAGCDWYLDLMKMKVDDVLEEDA
jgi:hypothetical protein